MNSFHYLLLADITLAAHIGVVAFVVFGLLFVSVGGVFKWQWVKNPWFRFTHLACILIVVAQAWLGMVCPLTTLEMWFRDLAGQATYSGSFITHWMTELLYYDLPSWVFTTAYTPIRELSGCHLGLDQTQGLLNLATSDKLLVYIVSKKHKGVFLSIVPQASITS